VFRIHVDIHGCLSEELGELQESLSVFRIVKFIRLLRTKHVARIEETANMCVCMYIHVVFTAEIARKISTWESQQLFGI
jgi:hypothetical protein